MWKIWYSMCVSLQYLIKDYELDVNWKQPKADNFTLNVRQSSISYYSNNLSYIMDDTRSRFRSLDPFYKLTEIETCIDF